MTHTTKHTPLSKAIRAIPMLYAEAFAGSNNKEFVIELYKEAALLEKAAPAMYEALQAAYKLLREWTPSGEDNQGEVEGLIENALAQAEGHK